MHWIAYLAVLDPFPIVLIVLGVVLVSAVYAVDHHRRKNRKPNIKEPITKLDIPDPSTDNQSRPAKPDSLSGGAVHRPPQGPALKTLSQKPSIVFDLLRVLLVLLSIVVAAGFLLILLPQNTTDSFVEDLRSRSIDSGYEVIAFLYLGHEIQNGEFHIRGVVRNITTEPLEQLDAVIRLYSHNRELLETAIVRMDKETIDPDQVAQFELVIPNFQSEFASYSVDFKLRRGTFVLYKDMRGHQEQSGAQSDETSD